MTIIATLHLVEDNPEPPVIASLSILDGNQLKIDDIADNPIAIELCRELSDYFTEVNSGKALMNTAGEYSVVNLIIHIV